MFPFNTLEDFKIDIPQELESFRKSVREFVEKVVSNKVNEIENKNEINEEIYQEAIKLGLTGIGIPVDYGGQGGDYLTLSIMIEEISRILPALATGIMVNHLFIYPVYFFGNEEQKKKYIPNIASGKYFAAHANTEPVAGSDVAGIQTTAKKEGKYYILNGRKMFITGAGRAQYFVVSARTSFPKDTQRRHEGISLFIVEKDFEGFKLGHRIDTMGLRGEQPYEIILDNVKVPEENIVGEEGKAFKIIVSTYDHGRIGVAAQAVGIMQGLIEKALNYSLQRKAFEKPLISYEGISFKIADALIKLEAARLLTYWAARLIDENKDEAILAASIAKTFATEAAEKVAIDTIKIHGGYGVDRETGIERYLRDTLITEIYEGANDIQRLTIAKSLIRKISGKSLEIS